MDVSALNATLEHAGPASLGLAVLAGLLFSFNPVALAAIPVSLAYVTKARQPRQALLFGTVFVAGMILTHAILGVVAGLGGLWVQNLLGRQWGLLLGPLLMFLGAVWLKWIHVPLPAPAVRATRATSVIGAAALGSAFSIAVCPICTPTLLVLLGVAAGIGSPLFGLTLLGAFAVGRAVPIVIGASAIGWLEKLRPLEIGHRALEKIGGIVLILSGLYMLNAYFFVIPWLG
ncbi:MAG: cytochrome c biogenesis CcdA family protein [Rhodospirillaceae bacterium]